MFQRGHGVAARLLGLLHAVGQRACAGAGRQVLRGQAAHVVHQRLHAAPHGQHGVQGGAIERVALLAPVVLRSLDLHGGFVGAQFLVKQVAAVKGVFAQHALAPGIDGVHGRVVHAFGGQRQAPGGLGARRAIGVGGQQIGQEGIVRGHGRLAPKALRRFYQAGADAVRQFARGGAGEGHHQNVGRAQRAGKGLAAPVAEHQAQVERSNGPGFARARAGLDEAAAPQREIDGVQRRAVGATVQGRAHAASPVAGAGLPASGWMRTCTCSRAQSASGPPMDAARASKRPSSVSVS